MDLKKKKIVILASGSGTNAENIFNFFQNNKQVEVVKLYCNKKNAFVFERAKKYNISSQLINRDFLNEKLLDELKVLEVDYVILAGFLLKIPDNLVSNFPNRIVNIHPSLLPSYGGKGMYGMHVHEAVIAARELKSGITIHFVNEHYDEGQVIFQAECEIQSQDTAEDLASKIHILEQNYFPRVLNSVINGVEIPTQK